MSHSFIPQNAAAFGAFMTNVCNKTQEYMKNWEHIPETAFRELSNANFEFDLQLIQTLPDSTRAQINSRNVAQRRAESVLRYFIRFYLRNPIVTDAQLISMGIPPIDTIRTMHKNVTETVDFVIHIRGTNNVILDFWQTGRHPSKARPRGFSGAVVIWNLSETEPARDENYEFHTLATRTPFTIEFNNHDSGKRVWFKIAWQNARGILGRFSEAKSAIVP